MSVLSVLKVPQDSHILKKKSLPIEEVTETERKILDDMLETMYATEGCGLAAPQVGILKRMVVIDFGPSVHEKPFKMVNPVITWASDTLLPYKVGCLSIPGEEVEVERPSELEVQYLDENGMAQTLKAKDILAHCVHHEIDHLEGILMIDYLSPLKKNISLRRTSKFQKNYTV